MTPILNQIGKKGESIAKDYLLENGYEVLQCNWRFKRSEIDIIAEKEEVLIFVEVKSRSSDHFGSPEEFIDDQKIKHLAFAASGYMNERGYEWEFRFDVISILFKDSVNYELRHIEDAFFPGLI